MKEQILLIKASPSQWLVSGHTTYLKLVHEAYMVSSPGRSQFFNVARWEGLGGKITCVRSLLLFYTLQCKVIAQSHASDFASQALPFFQRATLKNWERPGNEATRSLVPRPPPSSLSWGKGSGGYQFGSASAARRMESCDFWRCSAV